jgi:hypothetical protein
LADKPSLNFGLIIAYLIPGCIALKAFAPLDKGLAAFLARVEAGSIVAEGLIAVELSLAVGMTVTTAAPG